MKNVRCAGYVDPTEYDDREPCGWKGERFPSVPMWLTYNTVIGPVHEISHNYRLRATAKPCPRCGGQVELIPQDGES